MRDHTGIDKGSILNNASAHLACLEDCGLVTRDRRGKFVYYAITDKRVVKVLEEAEAILGEVGAHVFRCTRYEGRQSQRRPPHGQGRQRK